MKPAPTLEDCMSSPPAALVAAQPVEQTLRALDEPEETARFTRWEQGADGRLCGLSALQLGGLHCAACAGLIEDALLRVPGVAEARVNASSRRALVRWDPAVVRPSALVAAVQRAGYGAAADVAAAARELRRDEHRAALWRLFVASFLAMQVMMLATPSYVAPEGDLSPDLRSLLNWGSWVLSLPVLGFAGMPFLKGAWRSLRAQRIGMDVPVALGLLGAFVASSAATFDPAGAFGHEVYFDSLTMFLAFLWLGRYLEVRTRHRAAEALEAAVDGLPQTALRVLPDGSTDTVSVHRLVPGDRVRVPAGAAIAADGRLLSPGADLCEALLTGESSAVARRMGEPVLAGSVNVGSPFEFEVERVGADTRHEAIVALMREALTQRPSATLLADRWAGPFLWGVLLLAAGSAAVWSSWEPARAVEVAVAVLIVTCPCALWLATPSALVAAAGGLARRGVLLRRLDALEAMAEVTKVFVDKTGTLTEDRLRLERTMLVPGAAGAGVGDAQAALALAASLARWSSHPASRALADAAPGPGADPGWREVSELPGQGVVARDAQGRAWKLGSASWALGAGPAGGAAADAAAGPVVWLGCQGQPVALFELAEALREDAAQALRGLQALGLPVGLLSGDSVGRAQALARRLGIDEVAADQDPQGKLLAVRAAQAAGRRVAMVGDGLNDAPVLAAADVSMAMGHGALAARQGADAVIVSGRLAGVLDLAVTAARTRAVVRQNMAWAVVYNAACIPLAMVGWMPPWAAGLGMAASSLLVIVNAQRAGRSPWTSSTC
jgi:Cu2+-exporting ATPase